MPSSGNTIIAAHFWSYFRLGMEHSGAVMSKLKLNALSQRYSATRVGGHATFDREKMDMTCRMRAPTISTTLATATAPH